MLFPIRPFVLLVLANPPGFGLYNARKPRNVVLVQFPLALVYSAGFPALAFETVLYAAAKIGTGEVPGAPV